MPLLLTDSNYLRNPELRNYLRHAPSSKIAISEFVLIEAHKRNPRRTIIESFKIPREFAAQVFLLKSIPGDFRTPIASGEQARRMLDISQGKHFAGWYDDVVSSGEWGGVQTHLNERQKFAATVIEKLKAATPDIAISYDIIKSRLTEFEMREVRTLCIRQISTIKKLEQVMLDITHSLFKATGIPDQEIPKSRKPLTNYYLFRYAACYVLHFIHTSKGSPRQGDRAVNEIIDLQLAAEATYFHGLLTTDQTANAIHRQARHFLRSRGAFIPNLK